MPEDLDRTYSYGSTKSSSLRTSNTAYVAVQKERVSPSSSNNNRDGKLPTYTLQKAARMTAKVNHKWVRIASVIAYLIAISMTAVVLALYYILFYNPYTDLIFTEQSDDVVVSAAAQRSQHNPYSSYRKQLGLSVAPLFGDQPGLEGESSVT
ncbi:hypothetical protein BV898_05772 [Hypsibius exemplaris]|uniref:Transmembrane protein INAFM2 n=1 Tax=Hypsibius exemplaris TaxID=2072580 RepID=A0A1W0WYE0_HYPEX|nr:hypothetical protein BV898_05772 [Hypsibius exemplaris]